MILHQLLRGNRRLQDQVREHTEVSLDSFKSMEAALVWVNDIVKTGAVQERKTTVCLMGNTSAGKSSLVRTLENYCRDKSVKAILTGDPENKSFIETKVMELVREVEFEPKTKLAVDVREFRNEPKFRLICPSANSLKQGGQKADDNQHTERNVQVSFIDFAGHTEYVSCSTLLMRGKGIFFICFDTEKLMQDSQPISEGYHPAVGTYLETVTEKCPNPMFFVIGTKIDKCEKMQTKETLKEILESAKEHLDSISRRSSCLKSAFLYNEVIPTSAADKDQLEGTLQNLISLLVAVCDHRDLMDVRLKTMPIVWKEKQPPSIDH